MRKLLLPLVLCVLFSVFTVASEEFIVPSLPSSHIYDEVGLLQLEEKKILEDTIFALEKVTNHQIGIAILKSLQDRPVEEVGLTLLREWGIGQKGLDNGLLILLMPIGGPGERQMRIEVGKGLEGVITDLISKRIIDENFTPHFKTDNYIIGLTEGIERMTSLLKGEVVTLPEQAPDSLGILVTFLFWLAWGGVFLGSAFFEPSKAWWPGMIIGGALGGLVMWIAIGTVMMVVIGIITASGILGGLDFAFSRGIIKALNSRPNGGRWGGGGGFGGGSSGSGWGGFGGGGGWGGGASGRW